MTTMADDNGVTLRRFLLDEQARGRAPAEVADLLDDIAPATCKIAALLGDGALQDVLGPAGSKNAQGEEQKKLDLIANRIMVESLQWTGRWAGLASEEMADPYPVPDSGRRGRFLCLFDPLDGSSNTDVNGPLGTVFSILPAADAAVPSTAAFLQPGSRQTAAGYVVYGPATVLVLTAGRGVHGFTLDRRSGDYLLTHPDLRIPARTAEFAANMANQPFWAQPVQRYIRDCQAGAGGPFGKDYTMRWFGAMVADVHRVVCRGGIFLHPWDARTPDQPGKLRLLYEVNPVSFIIEQAGGVCTTGTRRILDIQPDALHQRCAAILGSRDEVQRLIAYHAEDGG